MNQFSDVTGQLISVDDIVAYTTSSEGASAISVGRVTRFSSKSLWVQPYDPKTMRPIQKDTGYYVKTGKYWLWDHAKQYEREEFVKTGKEDVGESIVGSPAPHRFLIIRKI